MAKITQKQLIESFEQLKEIKPRKEWAVLLKSQILAGNRTEVVITRKADFASIVYSALFPKKLVYAFAAFLILAVGIFGFAKLTKFENLPQQAAPAALTKQSPIKQNVVAFSSKINNLVQVAKEKKADAASANSDIKSTASELAKTLKDNPVQDPQTIKDIASSLETLADVQGTDLTLAPEIESLNNALAPYVENEIKDLEKTTLTGDQPTILAEIKNLYNQGKYDEAMTEIYTKLQPAAK